MRIIMKTAKILGIIGSIMGLIAGCIGFVVGVLTGGFSIESLGSAAYYFAIGGFLVLLFAFIGLIGSFKTNNRPILGGVLMLISGVSIFFTDLFVQVGQSCGLGTVELSPALLIVPGFVLTGGIVSLLGGVLKYIKPN